jgi:hypothetical protein
VAKDYNIFGQTFRRSTVIDVLSEIERDRPCITSVTVGFNGGKINSKGEVTPTGGHLVVVTGAVKTRICCKSSITDFKLNLENHFVNIEDFKRSFSGAFMSFWINK